MAVVDWLKDTRDPEDIYALLGRPLLDPDVEGLLEAVQSANDELHPYQNHPSADQAKRAMYLMEELGRALHLLSHPEKLREYNAALENALRRELTSLAVSAGLRRENGGWNDDSVRRWLIEERGVHHESAARLVRGLAEKTPARPFRMEFTPRPPIGDDIIPELKKDDSISRRAAVQPPPLPPVDRRTPRPATQASPVEKQKTREFDRPRRNRGRGKNDRLARNLIIGFGVAAGGLLTAIVWVLLQRPADGGAKARKPPDIQRGHGAAPSKPLVQQPAEAPPKPPEPNIGELIRRLASAKWPERRDSAEALGQAGPAAGEAVPDLVRLLSDGDVPVREAAVVALDQIEQGWRLSPAARNAIQGHVEQLASLRRPEREVALEALGRIDRHWLDSPEARKALPKLASALADPSEDVQQAALEALGRFGSKASSVVPALTRHLSSLDPRVRKKSGVALARIGNDARDAIPVLVNLLEHNQASVRSDSREVLDAIDPGWEKSDAVRDLVARLIAKLGNPIVAKTACARLGDLGAASGAAIPELVKLLVDREPRMRSEAGIALNRINLEWWSTGGAQSAIPELEKRWKEGSPAQKKAAREALDLIEMGRPKPPADRVADPPPRKEKQNDYAGEGLTHRDPAARKKAIQELEAKGEVAAESISELAKRLVDEDQGVRDAAGRALAKIDSRWYLAKGVAEAVPALIDGLLKNDWKVRQNAAINLGKIGKPAIKAVPDLVKCLVDQYHTVRQPAAEALEKIDAKWLETKAAVAAVPDLIKALSDSREVVRAEAVSWLGKIGPPAEQAIRKLVPRLADPIKKIREDVNQTLRKINPKWKASKDAYDAVPDLIRAGDLLPLVTQEEIKKILEQIDPNWRARRRSIAP